MPGRGQGTARGAATRVTPPPPATAAPPPAAAAPAAPVRLYVGGLPPGVTAAELAARFAPFGAVGEVVLAQPKVYGGGGTGGAATFARDFAHVELTPRDAAALRSCISAYSGCRWRGGLLRCSVARPRHTERLAAERDGTLVRSAALSAAAAPACFCPLLPRPLGLPA